MGTYLFKCNLTVLFVSPSNIGHEKFYIYCPPLLLNEIYAHASSSRRRDPDLRRRLALPSRGIFPGQRLRWGLLLLLDRNQMSGGKCGVPVGSARVSRGARDATLARPRLLNHLPDDRRRGGERESSPAPKRQKFSCSNVCVGCSFNKNAYILTKRAFSSSLNKCGSPCPASEQCRSAAHTSYSRASNDQAAKAAMSVHERVESYSGNLALATQRDRAGIYSSIQTQTTPFQWRGTVSNIASKCPASETRDRLSARERNSRASPTKRAGERFL